MKLLPDLLTETQRMRVSEAAERGAPDVGRLMAAILTGEKAWRREIKRQGLGEGLDA